VVPIYVEHSGDNLRFLPILVSTSVVDEAGRLKVKALF